MKKAYLSPKLAWLVICDRDIVTASQMTKTQFLGGSDWGVQDDFQ